MPREPLSSPIVPKPGSKRVCGTFHLIKSESVDRRLDDMFPQNTAPAYALKLIVLGLPVEVGLCSPETVFEEASRDARES